jgi:hypothetical protein
MIVQLVYISRPVTPVTHAVIEFVPIAQEKNVKHNITGLIISNESFYLQLIEGPREEISQLYSNIIKDGRHADIVLLRYTDVRVREFGNWSMAHVTLEELSEIALNGVQLPEKISPSTISGVQALALLRRVDALLRIKQGLGVSK